MGENNKTNLNLYIANPSKIAKDFHNLTYKDLIEILRLNQEKERYNVTYSDAISFVTKLIEIKNQENLLKINRKLVWATWFLAIATIILTLVLN